MPVQEPLITRRDILNHGASSDFLDEFRLRPIEVRCSTGGALGVAAFEWRLVGAEDWSNAEPSEPGATWTWEAPDPAFADVTFAAQAYVADNAWTIATSGTVTPQGGAPATVTATRSNVVESMRQGVTSDVVTWTQPRVVPPIISLGEGQRGWAAVIAVYRLKRRTGITPKGAGAGDDDLRASAEAAEKNFKDIGGSAERPPDLVDSSSSGRGAGLSLMPTSDPSRGWDEV